jgi:uncharacterized protein YbdZ (MbtH family)
MTEREEVYNVVVNDEGQYSIWSDDLNLEIPKGWRPVGKSGPKADCLSYIQDVWTDMRPLSLQKAMAEAERSSPPIDVTKNASMSAGPSLVERLTQGDHPVEAVVRTAKGIAAFKECIDRGYAHIRFTDTKGGTELKVSLERTLCDLTKGNFQDSTGTIRLAGKLTLDFVKVRCEADLDLRTLTGQGRLLSESCPG